MRFGEDRYSIEIMAATSEWLALDTAAGLGTELAESFEIFDRLMYAIPPTYVIRADERNLGLGGTTTEASLAAGASKLLAATGLFPPACATLRQVLEMVCLCLYFAEFEIGTGTIRRWREGAIPTPQFRAMLSRLLGTRHFQHFEEMTGWASAVRELYRELSGSVHLKGWLSSYTANSAVGIRSFEPSAFGAWAGLFVKCLRLSAAGLVYGFPSYTCELPRLIEALSTLYIEGFLEQEQLLRLRRLVGERYWKVAADRVALDGRIRRRVQYIVDEFGDPGSDVSKTSGANANT